MRFSLSRGATSALACLLAAFAGKGLAQPQSEPQPGTSESQLTPAPTARERLSMFLEQAEGADRRLEAIREEESTNGPYSVALIDQLQALALLYQEIGEEDLAIESIEKALQVERANFGLFSLDQVPLIEQLIAAEQARGNVAAADELERRLLRLAAYNPDDLRSVEILQEAGDRHLEIYRQYLAGDLPPEININIGFAGTTGRRSPPVGRTSVFRAEGHYLDAIGVLLRTESYAHEALSELEQKLLYTYYLELTEADPSPMRIDAIAFLGGQAHERLVAYQAFNDGTLEEIARALVALADWDLLFSHNSSALDRYRDAYRMLAGRKGYENLISELFAPDTPVVLPAFVPNPLVPAQPNDENYVDIAFDISRFGKSRAIDVVAASSEAAEDAARDVTRLISRSRFRPIFEDGEPMRAYPVVVRYRF